MPSQAEVIDLLKTTDLFADLTRRELAAVASSLRPLTHVDGEQIVAEGDSDGRFFIVLSGTAVAMAGTKKLATFGAGSYFGEISLIDRGPRTATVIASGTVETLSVASFTFRPLLKEHPDMMRKLLVKMCERVRALDKRLIG
jgi:CRP-like cAMP-binding protein